MSEILKEAKAEKILFDDMRKKGGGFTEVLFIRMLMRKQKKAGLEKVTDVLPPTDDGKYDIVLTVNGVQLPFIETMNDLRRYIGILDQAQFDEWAVERFGAMFEALDSFQHNMKQILEEQENKIRETINEHET